MTPNHPKRHVRFEPDPAGLMPAGTTIEVTLRAQDIELAIATAWTISELKRDQWRVEGAWTDLGE